MRKAVDERMMGRESPRRAGWGEAEMEAIEEERRARARRKVEEDEEAEAAKKLAERRAAAAKLLEDEDSDEEDDSAVTTMLRRIRLTLAEREASLDAATFEVGTLKKENEHVRALYERLESRNLQGILNMPKGLLESLKRSDTTLFTSLRGLDAFATLEKLLSSYLTLFEMLEGERSKADQAGKQAVSGNTHTSSLLYRIQELENLLNLRDRQVHTLLEAARVRVRTSPRTAPHVWENGQLVSPNDYYSAIEFAGRSAGSGSVGSDAIDSDVAS